VSDKILIDTGPSPRGWSRIDRALRCLQLFAWFDEEISGAEARKVPIARPLVRGSIAHVGLAHLYAKQQAIQQGWDPERYYSPREAMSLVAARFGEVGAAMHPIAESLVRGYAQEYSTDRFPVVGVERLVETDFLGVRYTARIDLELQDDAGRVWIYDHKTVAKIESKVLHRYTLSGQFLGLAHLGARLYGSRFGGIRLNLLSVNPQGYLRVTPEPAPWMLQKFPEVVRYAEESINRVRALAKAGEPLPASPSEQTCLTSYGFCPAFELCRWGRLTFLA